VLLNSNPELHEICYDRTKVFKVLQGRFHHSEEKIQTKMQFPLFDILTESVVNKRGPGKDSGIETTGGDDEE
jgi:hypothetical protein